MKIFINDIPVNLIKSRAALSEDNYSHVLDGQKDRISSKVLMDDVLIHNASPAKVEELLHLMTDKKLRNLDSVTFASTEKKALITYVKDKFTIVKAAGGVVEKEGRTLLIHRLGKWDLPKGKLDKGETLKHCAVREVEEETGVKGELQYKICHTWHTYTRNKKYVLKKTSWYAMSCLDDRKMAPQEEESIEDVRWMDLPQMREALYDSYRTVRFVVAKHHELLKASIA